MKKSERKEYYSKIAILLNSGKNKEAYEAVRDIASSEGLFILSEYNGESSPAIAAAPALLEAILRARQWVFDEAPFDINTATFINKEDDDLLSEIDAAIAAAKGE